MKKLSTAAAFAAASVLSLVLGVELGQAQQDQQQAGQQQPGQQAQQQPGQQSQQQQGQQAQQQQGQQGSTATVPQYWIADATIFVTNGYNAAGLLEQQGRFNVQAPTALKNQAQFMLRSTGRALQDLAALQENSLETNPEALPAIRYITGQLQAAQAQAEVASQVTGEGQLGPTFQVSIQSAMSHFANALQALPALGQSYNAPEMATVQLGTGQSQGGQAFGGQQFAGQPSGAFGRESHSAGYRPQFGQQSQGQQSQGQFGQPGQFGQQDQQRPAGQQGQQRQFDQQRQQDQFGQQRRGQFDQQGQQDQTGEQESDFDF